MKKKKKKKLKFETISGPRARFDFAHRPRAKSRGKSRGKLSGKKLRFKHYSTDYRFDIYIRKRVTLKSRLKLIGPYKRRRVMGFKRIKEEDFKPGMFYKIYQTHILSGVSRLYGYGKFDRLPVTISERTKYKRFHDLFKPLKHAKKNYRGWVPTWKLYPRWQEELEDTALAQKFITVKGRKSVDIRGSVFPLRRWYNPKWNVFSDKILNGNEYHQAIGISLIISYVYPRAEWISKRTIIIDLRKPGSKGIKTKNLVKYQKMWANEIDAYLDRHHAARDTGKAGIDPIYENGGIRINGFIPVKYLKKGSIG